MAQAWNKAVVSPVRNFSQTGIARAAYNTWYYAVGQHRLEDLGQNQDREDCWCDINVREQLGGVTALYASSAILAGAFTAGVEGASAGLSTGLAAGGTLVHVVPMQLHSLYVAGKHKAQQQAQPQSPQ